MLSERDRRLAGLALGRRVLTREQLLDCISRTEALGASLEQILLERSYLSPVELHELRRLTDAPPRFAEIVRERGLASEAQVSDALRHKNTLAAADVERPVGRILIERSVLTEAQVGDILAEQARRTPDGRDAYRLGEELARGPAAVVHRAVEVKSGREVALKTVPGATAALPRLQRARSVSHPNLARVLDCGTHGADLWIASAYVEGLPLYDHVVGCLHLPLEEATTIFKQIAAALGAAHAAGLPHGSLTPRNVLLTEMREARLTDLALRAGSTRDDLRAAGSLWAFMIEGEQAGLPRFRGRPPLVAAIYARLAGATYPDARALASDLDRLDEDLLHRAQEEEESEPDLPAPTPAPPPEPPRRLRPRRR